MFSFINRKIIEPIRDKYWEIKYRNNPGDPMHDGGMRHVWGLKSYDDLCASESNLYTMNDIEIIYHDDTEDYGLSIETMFEFREQGGDRTYLKRLLERLTEWMVTQGYSTENKLWLYGVFTEGYNINKRFKTIEEVYANFKMLVNGYCSL